MFRAKDTSPASSLMGDVEREPFDPRLQKLACTVLFVIVLVSSVSVIYVRHQNRVTFVALHQAGQERDGLNVEWGQLLIEESLWSFPHRIEKDAVEMLGMKMPEPGDIRLVEYQE